VSSATDFQVGSLVRARGREWVVLPESEQPRLLVLRPLGGTDEEIAGILTSLEDVEPATFALPSADDVGDHRSARLLRDALRLGFRSGAGPFRSFANIAVEPRPYQLVPLLMALKHGTVRLLIADDVGVGKTIEALLVARELYDQGDADGIAVLCPPHLAEQWQVEMRDKFHLEADLVLTSTAPRLERGLRVGESLFDRSRVTVVSTDFIKAERRRNEFLRGAPNLVIVDEAHTCADTGAGRGRHQRRELLTGLVADRRRHLILVTATPHSGNRDAFSTLIGFLDPAFANLPDSLEQSDRAHLAKHLVQRRRADVQHYDDAETPFPTRETMEQAYALTPEYRALFDRVLAYARERVRSHAVGDPRARVHWWAVLGLLRALASSPAAAAETLRARAQTTDASTTEEIDEVGRRTVLDLADDDQAEGIDVTPGADSDDHDVDSPHRKRLLAFARDADALRGALDPKLTEITKLLKTLVKDGFNPIVFCRFIATAEYLREQLAGKLGRDVEVAAVTGRLPPAERAARVAELGEKERRVLVATDCLSEGVNLQDHFDSVVHYDLSWNPTRHEQREGRVDRYGQPSRTVRALMFYGRDNRIDGIVLDVLLRKHRAIQRELGISVPVPIDSNAVLESILEGLLLRGDDSQLALFEAEVMAPKRADLHGHWDVAADREKRSRTRFAQAAIKVEEVHQEVAATRAAIGAGVDVASFAATSLRAVGANVAVATDTEIAVGLSEVPRALRDTLGTDRVAGRFELPVGDGQTHLTRTHPLIAGLATYVLDTALDASLPGPATRCGVTRTQAVTRRTTVLLLRYRFDVVTRRADGTEHRLLAEEAATLAFAGTPADPEWLDADRVDALLAVEPSGNVIEEQKRDIVARLTEQIGALDPAITVDAERRAGELLAAHRRVRAKGERYRVEAKLPADILGIYVLLPAPNV
jgi:superfamily II DNA or RNA helicase